MWFKQAQIYQLQTSGTFNVAKLIEQLQPLAFTPCLPSFPSSYGWVSPLEEDEAPLAFAAHGCITFCLQFEEKILPAAVVRQEVNQKVKELEAVRGRKVSQKEKLNLKDEITYTLLPQAFSKLSNIHAYIDTKNNWLVINTTHAAKSEKFLELLKKSLKNTQILPIASKLGPTLTRWLVQHDYPQEFAIEKSCLLRDPRKESRMIRCQQQDLSVDAVHLMIKDGCEVHQLALSWQDRVGFTLLEDFSLRSIKFYDAVIAQAKEMEPETKQQQFAADFFIMTETFSALLNDLQVTLKPKHADGNDSPNKTSAPQRNTTATV